MAAIHKKNFFMMLCFVNQFWVSYPVVLYPSKSDYLGMAKPSPKHAGNEVLAGLGVAIRSARTELGLSQEDLAVDAELDRSYVGGIERGEHNLTLINLQKLAIALNIRPSKLLQLAGY